jgi:hypothetical protein
MPILMIQRSLFTRGGLAALAASSTLVIASCGESSDFGLGPRYPVSGTVTYNGKPLERGQINFTPEDPTKGVGAMGHVENGSYTLSTVGDKDGARPGKYKVTVTAKEDSEDRAKAEFEKAKAKFKGKIQGVGTGTENSARIPREFLTRASREAKSLIPAGYGDARTTKLTAEVNEQSNTIDFKLSDEDAPPAPPKEGRGRPRVDK